MADRDNGKVEHPLTLGPRRWEEGAVCVHLCVYVDGTGVEGAGSRVGEGCLGRDSPRGLWWHAHTYAHT